MKIHDVRQGTEDWAVLRLGIPTASRFSDIVTPKRLKPSARANDYIAELLAEWMTGVPADAANSAFMDRGTELEPEALGWLEFDRDVTVDRVGFITTDDGKIGCSPDGLIGDDRGVEVKCLAAKNHIKYLLNGPSDEYRLQVQGGLWLAERATWWLVAYNPEIQPAVFEIGRDDEAIDALSIELLAFLERLEEAKQRLRSLGCVPWNERRHATDETPTMDEIVAELGDQIA